MLNDQTIIEKCKAKYQLVSEYEREIEMHKDRTDEAKKKKTAVESEIRRLITTGHQGELPLEGAPDTGDLPEPE